MEGSSLRAAFGRIILVAVALAAAFAAASCRSAPDAGGAARPASARAADPAVDPARLMGGVVWRVAPGTSSFPSPERLTLILSPGSAAGSGGVNRFQSEVSYGPGAVSFGPLGRTKMAGDPDEMEQERVYFALLGRVARFKLSDGRLRLYDAAGVKLLELEKAPGSP